MSIADTIGGSALVQLPDGEEVTVWNHVTVYENHGVHATEITHNHAVFIGDGSVHAEPDYITGELADQLQSLDVTPDAEVVDLDSDEVTVL